MVKLASNSSIVSIGTASDREYKELEDRISGDCMINMQISYIWFMLTLEMSLSILR